MTALVMCAVVLLILFLLGQIPLAVGGSYGEYEKPMLWVKLSALKINILPRPDKPRKEKKQKKEKRKSDKQKKKLEVGQIIAMVLDLLPVVKRTVVCFVQKLRMDELKLFIIIPAEDDPAEGAIRYGQAQAMLGALWQPLVELFHIEDGRAGVRVDFESNEMVLHARGQLSIKLGQLLAIVLALAIHALHIFLRHRKPKKLRGGK